MRRVLGCAALAMVLAADAEVKLLYTADDTLGVSVPPASASVCFTYRMYCRFLPVVV